MRQPRVRAGLLASCLFLFLVMCAGHANDLRAGGTWKGTMVSRANRDNQYAFTLRILDSVPMIATFRVHNLRTRQVAVESMKGVRISSNRVRLVGERFESAPPGWFLDELDLTFTDDEVHGVYREKGRAPIRGDLRGRRQ